LTFGKNIKIYWKSMVFVMKTCWELTKSKVRVGFRKLKTGLKIFLEINRKTNSLWLRSSI